MADESDTVENGASNGTGVDVPGSTNTVGGTPSAKARYNHLASASDDPSSENQQNGQRSGSKNDAKSTPDFLALVLDCNPFSWAAAAEATSAAAAAKKKGSEDVPETTSSATEELEKTLRDALIFLNAHMALQHDNGLAVYASAGSQARLLFSTATHSAAALKKENQTGEETQPDANTFQHFKTVDARVHAGVKRLLEIETDLMEKELDEEMSAMDVDGDAANSSAQKRKMHAGGNGVVSALSQALCHINRLNVTSLGVADPASSSIAHSVTASADAAASTRAFRSRIVVLSVTPDASTQYVAMMNCIFGAQKSMIPINVCKLHGEDSVFLQQASHLTNGNYLRCEDRRGLLQMLLSAFLPSRSISSLIHLPNQDEVDFRAACFCHRRIVNVGYVCSVCLSIFCEPLSSCATCRSRFPKRSLQRFQNEHKLLQIIGVSQ